MKPQMKKYLLCGGVLLGLGVISAGLLSGVNLITAPLIEASAIEKANATYREIFPEANFSEKMTFSTDEEKDALAKKNLKNSSVDYYLIAYDESKAEIGKVFHGSAVGHDGTVEVLVGFCMKNGDAALKKIAVLNCSDTWKTTFEKNYLNPVNEGTKSYDDLTNVGATVTSTAVSSIVIEAGKLYSALGGGVVEDPSSWNDAAFAGKSYKVSSSHPLSDSSYPEFTKYYSYFDDALGHNEIGRWYVGKSGDFSAALAIGESGFEGAYILSSSYTDVDYASSPFFSASSLPTGETGDALKALKGKAEALCASSPFSTLTRQAIALFEDGESAVKTELNQTIAGVSGLGFDPTSAWPSEKKQVIMNRYAVSDKDGKKLGVAYEAQFHLSCEIEEGGVEYQAHGGLYFLLGFSGENYDNPSLTRISALENTFSRASTFQTKVLDAFNNGSDHSWSAFKSCCAAEGDIGSSKIGATISSQGLYGVANLERQDYAALKGGK